MFEVEKQQHIVSSKCMKPEQASVIMKIGDCTVAVLLACSFTIRVAGVMRCAQVERQSSPSFQLVRRCSRSAMSVLVQANVTSLGRCADLAAARRGLAFNYSPRGAPRSETLTSTCLVLDCPEFDELTSLHRDEAYDYYSLFTDPMPRSNWSCVPGVGLFHVRGLSAASDRANRSEATERCAADSGALAHVVSDARTSGLSALLSSKTVDSKNRTVGPANKAYVDLDDVEQEGLFVTSAGEPLDCFPFRAWSPGEPRTKSPKDDCVVLERRRGWAVTDCARKLPFICELYPGPAGECDHEDSGQRHACLELRRLRGRPEDRCEGWDLLDVPPPEPTTTASPVTPPGPDDYSEDGDGDDGGGEEEDDDDDDDGDRLARWRHGRN